MLVKTEYRYGSAQCGSMMSIDGGENWYCCQHGIGHGGAHFNDTHWWPEWDEAWVDPVYHNRCLAWDGDVRCTHTITGHGGYAHAAGRFSIHTWGRVVPRISAARIPLEPAPRTYAQRKGRRY